MNFFPRLSGGRRAFQPGASKKVKQSPQGLRNSQKCVKISFQGLLREQKKHIKKTHINNFRGSWGGGAGGRFRGSNSLCLCHFSPFRDFFGIWGAQGSGDSSISCSTDLVGRRFAHQRFADSRESIRKKKTSTFKALGQIRANRFAFKFA